MKRILLNLAILLALSHAADKFLSNTLGSHMVLPRAPQKAALWGWTDVGVTVNATFNGAKTYTTRAQTGGFWKIELDPQAAGGPHKITIVNSKNTNVIQLVDILFGDVFFCSGQSNMVFTVNKAFGSAAELARASDFPNMRIFMAALRVADQPQDNLLGTAIQWSRPSNVTLKEFSAVCWYFGKNIHLSTKVPVGLVTSAWGGTIIQAWSSPKANSQCSSSLIAEELPAANEIEGNSDSLFAAGEQPNLPSKLWNAMVTPFLNWRFTGVAWYQGEQNQRQSKFYECAFPTMIQDWAVNFKNPNIPFFFVQVATWKGSGSNVPSLRFAQTSALKLKNVAMAVSFDLSDVKSPYGDIHPRNKSEVGRRLSLPALQNIYKQKVRLGPVIEKAVKTAGADVSVTISFVESSGVVALRAPLACPTAPEVHYCGQVAELQAVNGTWHTAEYKLVDQKFVLTVRGVKDAKAARYAFADYPFAVVWNDIELPLPPFVLTL